MKLTNSDRSELLQLFDHPRTPTPGCKPVHDRLVQVGLAWFDDYMGERRYRLTHRGQEVAQQILRDRRTRREERRLGW